MRLTRILTLIVALSISLTGVIVQAQQQTLKDFNTAVQVERNSEHTNDLERRVTSIEESHLDNRIAHLEEIATSNTSMLKWIFASLAVLVIDSLYTIVGKKKPAI